MYKDKLIIEKINNLKDTRSSMWFAIIAVTGALSAVAISMPESKTIASLIVKVLILIPAIFLDFFLIASLNFTNKTINKLFSKMEN